MVNTQRRAKQYTVTWSLFEEEDFRTFDAFLNGPSAGKVVLMSLRPLPPDWEMGLVDPNQGEDAEDTSVHWQDDLARIIDHMTTDADAPA